MLVAAGVVLDEFKSRRIVAVSLLVLSTIRLNLVETYPKRLSTTRTRGRSFVFKLNMRGVVDIECDRIYIRLERRARQPCIS